jgi:hypothetical protein
MIEREIGNISLSVVTVPFIHAAMTGRWRSSEYYATSWRKFSTMGGKGSGNFGLRLSAWPDREQECAALSTFYR